MGVPGGHAFCGPRAPPAFALPWQLRLWWIAPTIKWWCLIGGAPRVCTHCLCCPRPRAIKYHH